MAIAYNNSNKNRYRDLDLNFIAHPIKKDINILTDMSAIVNSVKNLILLNHFEKPFHPEIGSNVRKMLFENMDSISASILQKEIKQTIINFEPRVSIQDIQVTPDYDNNRFTVSMTFTTVNKQEPVQIEFFLARER
jgi:phage baseplate assembly protein W